ncbi:unnamed protein product [Fraxinus pennsylvanica]|uniref:Uncharacterized protein n=1 Tax=Fraxinus pennsylvanica TaxID=56036 RepID=A0AAD2DVF7_9LAMI|nr:unnamed protein product [Fraxinus pennsylvanica]
MSKKLETELGYSDERRTETNLPTRELQTSVDIHSTYAESAMNKNLKPPIVWKLPVLVLELSSLHTETAYRDGATKRETRFVIFVYRLQFPLFNNFGRIIEVLRSSKGT